MEFNKEYLDGIERGKIRHPFYKVTVEHAQEMGVHVEGETPERLLKITRPNEQKDVREYRLASYQPVTKSLSEKVINTVNKIFNPRIWSFNFPQMTTSESLEKYLTEDYPFYRSIMNFITETFTVKDFSDPNGLMVVMPQSFDIEETELFEPVATIYSADALVDFEEEHYYTVLVGDVIKIFTRSQILYYKKERKNNTQKWVLIFEYTHDFGFVPAFRLGGIIKGKQAPFYYESWIRGVLPHWNQVVTLTSDLQAAYVNHLYMDKWEYATECDNADCSGGVVEMTLYEGKDAIVTEGNCTRCLGTGRVSKNPYNIYTVNRDALNPDAPLPTPPAGYIDKPIDVVDKVEDRISKEEKRGLASINMEIVQMVGNDQSGVAKTVDREDLHSFLFRYSRHVFEYVLPNMIFNIAAWRYGETADVAKILPEINDPKDLSVLNLDQLTSEYKDASNANVSSTYLAHIERELINNKFANNEQARRKSNAIISLNPFAGRNDDDLLTLRNLGVNDWEIYKAVHLEELVDIAIENDPTFLEKALKDQREIINQMAKEGSGFTEETERIPTDNNEALGKEEDILSVR